jgi:diaminopimelate decarboxylase
MRQGENMEKHHAEYIGVRENGHLYVEDCDCVDLAKEYGTPLYVTSENQLRHNYRKFYNAFASRYTGNKVQPLYAIKANNNLAVRRILFQEGAGGDCFGLGEMYATFLGGADPRKIVLNGSNKTEEELEHGVQMGVKINVCALEELDKIERIASKYDKIVAINIRIKPEIEKLRDVYLTPDLNLADRILQNKWGLSLDLAADALDKASSMKNVDLRGLHFHLGRHTNKVEHFQLMIEGVIEFAAELRKRTGWAPSILDLGGGFAHGSDPEGQGKTEGVAPIEEYAEVFVRTLKADLNKHDLPEPALEVEPGRYLVGNTTVLLARVGVVKEIRKLKKWVNVDASTNQLQRILLSEYRYQAIVANKALDKPESVVDIVGPLCIPDVLAGNRKMPKIEQGDLIAFPEAGMYAESVSNNFNGIPRPATVLVCGHLVDIIKERETVQDVFAHHRIPLRLLAKGEGSQ